MFLFFCVFFFLMIRRPPRSTLSSSSAASDVYKRQTQHCLHCPQRSGTGGVALAREQRRLRITLIQWSLNCCKALLHSPARRLQSQQLIQSNPSPVPLSSKMSRHTPMCEAQALTSGWSRAYKHPLLLVLFRPLVQPVATPNTQLILRENTKVHNT
eukprot:TRINITY_DN4716_c0_g1_i3.p1 TRINITY_DN4716_c0_g1~~TRINITY_DN4716_c0_g1_i3.p1  ORF type:complete len:156 (+),score=29.52 TRINITY_DN4716_c0_g1_i3:65-532(+)